MGERYYSNYLSNLAEVINFLVGNHKGWKIYGKVGHSYSLERNMIGYRLYLYIYIFIFIFLWEVGNQIIYD